MKNAERIGIICKTNQEDAKTVLESLNSILPDLKMGGGKNFASGSMAYSEVFMKNFGSAN
jgi:hypothetical protein